jgi:hypothetical protein
MLNALYSTLVPVYMLTGEWKTESKYGSHGEITRKEKIPGVLSSVLHTRFLDEFWRMFQTVVLVLGFSSVCIFYQ